jgi:hypothetical protein
MCLRLTERLIAMIVANGQIRMRVVAALDVTGRTIWEFKYPLPDHGY